MNLILLTTFACLNNISGQNRDLEPDVDDTSVSGDGAIPVDSMENFKVVYCEGYAERCAIYDSLEDCESEFDSWYGPTCTIVDKATFDECADWLFSLDCNTEGWIHACDTFYECS